MAAGFIIKHGEWSNTQAPNKQKGYLINKNIGTSFNIGKSPIHSYISQTCGYHWRNTACKTDSWFVDDTAVSNNLENTQVSLSIEGHFVRFKSFEMDFSEFREGNMWKIRKVRLYSHWLWRFNNHGVKKHVTLPTQLRHTCLQIWTCDAFYARPKTGQRNASTSAMLDMTIPQCGYIILMAKMDKNGEFPQISEFTKSSIACICGTVLRHCRHGRPLWWRHLRGAWCRRHRCHLRRLRRLHHRRHVGGRSQARPCAKGSKGGRSGVEGGNVMDVAGTWESNRNLWTKDCWHLDPFRGTRMWGWLVLRHLRKMHSSQSPSQKWLKWDISEIILKDSFRISKQRYKTLVVSQSSIVTNSPCSI